MTEAQTMLELADELAKEFPQTFTTYGDGKTTNALAVNVARYITARATAAAQPVAHALNEWADLGSNAVQWIRNIAEGISSADDALHEMVENYERVLTLSRAASPPPTPAGDTGAATMPCDFYVGPVHFLKGVKVETVRQAALRWYKAATIPADTQAMREATIDECIRELETAYPEHAWLNAACAALRALAATGHRAEDLQTLVLTQLPK